MVNWSDTSLRNLVYHLCNTQDERQKQLIYDALCKKLGSYLNGVIKKREWKILYDQQEEIVANVIEKLIKLQPFFKGSSWQYDTYVHPLLLRACAEWLRYEYRHISLENKHQQDNGENISDWLEVIKLSANNNEQEAESPEKLLLNQERNNSLTKAYNQLEQKEQELLYRQRVLEQSTEEIASAMKLSESNVRVSLSRATDQLNRILLNDLLSKQNQSQKGGIEKALAQLRPDLRLIMEKWWYGKFTWKQLGALFDPPKNQNEIKELFVKGFSSLFELLH